MALADRRPLAFPASTPASPSFHAMSLIPASPGGVAHSPDSASAGSGDPGSGDPGSGDPGSGDPDGSEAGSGDPGSGDPGSGDPGSGDPGSGDPDGSEAGSASEAASEAGSTGAGGTTGASSVASYDAKPLTPMSPMELSPTLRSILPDSLVNADSLERLRILAAPPLGGGSKKPKPASRTPIATGILTTIPVTGEKPKPQQKNDASLQDDVLYAIFLILYEKDPAGAGMTVKQICDTLVERHPDMANLSTKTSNLVSAKLNAYVKRVEKGDANLKYALLRDWADALPKRMVYVYRGLLTNDFHLHVKAEPRAGLARPAAPPLAPLGAPLAPPPPAPPPDAFGDALGAPVKQRRQTMFDLGVTKNTFLDCPIDKLNLFVPYLSAPVTALLSRAEADAASDDDAHSPDAFRSAHGARGDSDMELEDFEVFDDDDEFDIETAKHYNRAKRSKSLLYLTLGKKSKVLTAAAAAPRALRAPCLHSASAAAAAAALHAAATRAMLPTHDARAAAASAARDRQRWLGAVRPGFMTEEIGTPEDISLSELDRMFN